MATHPGARYGGPAWLAVGLVLYVVVRGYERAAYLFPLEPRNVAADIRLLAA